MAAMRLGPGEREAIALAVELGADEIILDDLSARRMATSLGIPVIGTLGLLLRAKKRGLIREVRPLVEALQSQGFRISERVLSGILAAAGEGTQEEVR
jgi:predicted nucleic acid-binding protein